MKYFEDAWNAYRAHVVPKDATPEAVAIGRQAFFAGAQCCWALVVDVANSGEVSDDAFNAILSAAEAELAEVKISMRRVPRSAEVLDA